MEAAYDRSCPGYLIRQQWCGRLASRQAMEPVGYYEALRRSPLYAVYAIGGNDTQPRGIILFKERGELE